MLGGASAGIPSANLGTIAALEGARSLCVVCNYGAISLFYAEIVGSCACAVWAINHTTLSTIIGSGGAVSAASTIRAPNGLGATA